MGFCSEVLQENINTVRLNANINLIIIESFPVNYEENLRVWYGLKNWNKNSVDMQQEVTKNNEFYQNCTQYFEFLRKKSTVDYDFEDEYYFTMPAISSHQ